MDDFLFAICGLVFALIAWASMGSSGEMKAKGDKGWRFSSVAGFVMLILALLCWRAVG